MMNRVQQQDEAACVEMSLTFTFWVCYNAGGGVLSIQKQDALVL